MSDKPFDNCRQALKELNNKVKALNEVKVYLQYLEGTVLKAIEKGYRVGGIQLYDVPTDEAVSSILSDYGFSWEDNWSCWYVALGNGIEVEIKYLNMEVDVLIATELTKV